MRYLMRQKLFTFCDDFIIKDEAGAEQYLVDGRAFSFGKKLSFQDMAGHELAFISQQVFAWGPSYEIYRDGALAATVKKQNFTFLGSRFQIEVPGENDLEAHGNFNEHAYQFLREGNVVAEVSKAWVEMPDTYGVDISDTEDPVLLLACTVVIDMVCHPDHKSGLS